MKTLLIGAMAISLFGCQDKKSPDTPVTGTPKMEKVSVNELEKEMAVADVKDLDIIAERTVAFDVDRIQEKDSDYYRSFVLGMNKRLIKVVVNGDKKLPEDLFLHCKGLGYKTNSSVGFQLEIDLADVEVEDLKLECEFVDPAVGSILTKALHLKKDLLISKDSKKGGRPGYGSLKEYDVVLLEEDSKLLTNGMDLKLKTRVFYSEGATIKTLENNLQPRFDKIGKSGGDISIIAEEAHGHLSVALVGVDGGKNTADDLQDYTHFKYAKKIFASNGLPCKPGSYLIELNPRDVQGYRGGDSGTFTLKAKTNTLLVDYTVKPGRGGEGALSQLLSKEKTVRAKVILKNKVEYIPASQIGIMEDYTRHKKIDFAYCGDITSACVGIAPNGSRKELPHSWSKKIGWMCMGPINFDGPSYQGSAGTNYHYREITLDVPVLSKQTPGLPGEDGRACRVQSTYDSEICVY